MYTHSLVYSVAYTGLGAALNSISQKIWKRSVPATLRLRSVPFRLPSVPFRLARLLRNQRRRNVGATQLQRGRSCNAAVAHDTPRYGYACVSPISHQAVRPATQ